MQNDRVALVRWAASKGHLVLLLDNLWKEKSEIRKTMRVIFRYCADSFVKWCTPLNVIVTTFAIVCDF